MYKGCGLVGSEVGIRMCVCERSCEVSLWLLLFSVYFLPIVQGKTEQEAKEVGGKIFTFGSYRLGVHGKGKPLPFICIEGTPSLS